MAQPNASKKCPKCNRIFVGVGAQTGSEQPCVDLRVGNPLAYRILSRVQVRCALAECKWTGDYSELSSHLTASDSHHTRASGGAQSAKQDAEALKLQGNARFEARSFQEAIKLYSKAITLDPTQVNFRMTGLPASSMQFASVQS
jgi:DnaJ family protein C protein 7